MQQNNHYMKLGAAIYLVSLIWPIADKDYIPGIAAIVVGFMMLATGIYEIVSGAHVLKGFAGIFIAVFGVFLSNGLMVALMVKNRLSASLKVRILFIVSMLFSAGFVGAFLGDMLIIEGQAFYYGHVGPILWVASMIFMLIGILKYQDPQAL